MKIQKAEDWFKETLAKIAAQTSHGGTTAVCVRDKHPKKCPPGEHMRLVIGPLTGNGDVDV